MNKKVAVVSAIVSYGAVLINWWFFAGFITSALCRMYSGHIISVIAGAALGVILIEVVNRLTY